MIAYRLVKVFALPLSVCITSLSVYGRRNKTVSTPEKYLLRISEGGNERAMIVSLAHMYTVQYTPAAIHVYIYTQEGA